MGILNLFKDKIVLVLAILLVTSVGGNWVLQKMYSSEKKERIRTENNQDILLGDQQQRYTVMLNKKDSVHVLATNQLMLDKKELRQNRDSLTNIVEKLGIKLRRVESITESKTTIETKFDAPIEDKLVIVKDDDGSTTIDTLRCIEHETDYSFFSACIDEDTLRDVTIRATVPLIQVVERDPKFRIFKIPFGTKGFTQHILSKNPDATVEYAEYIKLK